MNVCFWECLNVRFRHKADIQLSPSDVRFTPKKRTLTGALHHLFRPDDHCPVNSVAILCMCDTDPLRAAQQQIGAMYS
jgi:hypothetical protein